jgi:hypothetical protein
MTAASEAETEAVLVETRTPLVLRVICVFCSR